MPPVALFIKTFLRDDTLQLVIDSIREHAQRLDYRIYIADDGEIDDDKQALYEQLESEGHRIIRLPFDMGASGGRNAALRYIEEPYILRMDDDFIFTEETRVDRMVAVLDADTTIGAIADLEVQQYRGKGLTPGQVSPGQGELVQMGATLWKVPAVLETVDWETADGVRYARCGFARNFLLIRRELLDHIRWDRRLKIRGEHVDFMLQIVRRSDWDLAFTPDSRHVHAGPAVSEQPAEYAQFRYRDAGFREILYEKWGFERILLDQPGGSSRIRRAFRSTVLRR